MSCSSLSSLYSRLGKKQAELARLMSCQKKHGSCHQHFYQMEYICMEPPISSLAWQGNFDHIPEDKKAVYSVQPSLAYKLTAMNIVRTKREIVSLQHAIAHHKAQFARLTD